MTAEAAQAAKVGFVGTEDHIGTEIVAPFLAQGARPTGHAQFKSHTVSLVYKPQENTSEAIHIDRFSSPHREYQQRLWF